MCIKSKLNFLFFGLIFFGCKPKESPDFYYTSEGLRYKFHDVAVSEFKPEFEDYLVLNLKAYSASSDTIAYFSSSIYHSHLDVFFLDSAIKNTLLYEGFLQLVKGDSVSFYLNGESFCRDYLRKDSCFFDKNKELVITFRLENIIKSEKELVSSFLLEEDVFITKTIEIWNNNYDTVYNYGLINWIYMNQSSGESIQLNDEISVHYTCRLPNNEIVYSTDSNSFDQFIVGLEGQMIEGYDYLLQHLNYGDHVIALIPSFLGFKDKGGVNGRIPPNTPLIFDVKVMQKRN